MTGPRKLKNGQWQLLIKLNIRGDSSSPSKNQTWQHSIKSTWASITPKLTWTATYPGERPNINRIMARENANRQTQEETLLEHLPLAFALERGARNTQKKTKNERNTYIHLAIHPAVPTQTRPLKKGYRKYLQCARCCPPMCKSSIRSRQLQRLKMVRFRGTRYETMDPARQMAGPVYSGGFHFSLRRCLPCVTTRAEVQLQTSLQREASKYKINIHANIRRCKSYWNILTNPSCIFRYSKDDHRTAAETCPKNISWCFERKTNIHFLLLNPKLRTEHTRF